MSIIYIDKVDPESVGGVLFQRHLDKRAIIQTKEPITLEQLHGFLPETMTGARIIYTESDESIAHLMLFSNAEKVAMITGQYGFKSDDGIEDMPADHCMYCPFIIYKGECMGQSCPVFENCRK